MGNTAPSSYGSSCSPMPGNAARELELTCSLKKYPVPRDCLQVELGERMALQIFAATEASAPGRANARAAIYGRTRDWAREDARISKAENDLSCIVASTKSENASKDGTISQVRTSRDVCMLQSIGIDWCSAHLCCRPQLDAHPPVTKSTGLHIRFRQSAVSHIMPPLAERKNCNKSSWTMSLPRGSSFSHPPTLADDPGGVITIMTTACLKIKR